MKTNPAAFVLAASHFLRRLRALPFLGILLCLITCLTTTQAQNVPMRVQRLDGWGPYSPIADTYFDLDVTSGDLHPNCSFVPQPPQDQWKTLSAIGYGSNPESASGGFLTRGSYYLFGPFEYEQTYMALYPWATFVRGPDHGPGKNGHWKITGCGGGGGGTAGDLPKFGPGRSAWRARGSRARLTVPQINNPSSTRKTGTLQVYLMAHRNRSAVSRGAGRVLCVLRYGQLSPNYLYRARSATTRYYRAPKGRFCTALILAEWTGRYTTRDSRVFPGKARFR